MESQETTPQGQVPITSLGEKTRQRAGRLIALRRDIERVVDSLNTKTKAVISAVEMLASVEGASVDVTYGSEIVNMMFSSRQFIDAALRDLPDDKDVAMLAEVYDLSKLLIGNPCQ
jgi:hypothetical protein